MAASEPQHPPVHAAVGVRGVDISGGASTVGRDRSGARPKTLIEKLDEVLAAQAAAKVMRDQGLSLEEVEQRALHKSRKRYGKLIARGNSHSLAKSAAFHRYQALGGRASTGAWSRKVFSR